MLNYIDSRAGSLLKIFAVFIFILGIGFSLFFGIYTIQTYPAQVSTLMSNSYTTYIPAEFTTAIKAQYRETGTIIIIGGCIGTLTVSLLLLGFGQLVDDHSRIRQMMEYQLGLQNDQGYTEQEEIYANAQQDYKPEPQKSPQRYKSSNSPAELKRQQAPYPTWMDDVKPSEDNYSAGWRIKTDKKG